MGKYVNSKIKKLQKTISKLITELHKEKFKRRNNRDNIEILNKFLEKVKIRNKIRKINQSVNNYWIETISKIKPHDSENMFPKINAIFRRQDKTSLPNL